MEENDEVADPMQTEENAEEKKIQAIEELDGSQKIDKYSKGTSEKRGKRKLSATESTGTPKKLKGKESATPLIDRPARERKSVERFADSVEKEKEKEKSKELKIEQGLGFYLRDIPNVVFKLSKRKTSDEVVQLLHKILFNKRVKPRQVKSNILQFSGFIWGPNEEKEKTKLTEKLEKIVKDNLFQLCHQLDLSMARTTKKEDVVLRLVGFLERPHKTTEMLIQDQSQKDKKRARTPTKGKRMQGSSQTARKRQRKEPIEEEQEEYEEREEVAHVERGKETPEEFPVKKKTTKIKEPSYDAKSSSAKKALKKLSKSRAPDDDVQESEELAQEAEAKNEEDPKETTQKRPRHKKKKDGESFKSPQKGSKKSVKTKSAHEPAEDFQEDNAKDVKSKPLSKVLKKTATTSLSKESSRKKKKKNIENAPEANSKNVETSQLPSKRQNEAPTIPPDEDLRPAICELLRNADFSTVTFTDVVKQLGAKFNVDLSQKKGHVKILIQEEISKIVDEDDGDGDDEETGVTIQERREKKPIEAPED